MPKGNAWAARFLQINYKWQV